RLLARGIGKGALAPAQPEGRKERDRAKEEEGGKARLADRRGDSLAGRYEIFKPPRRRGDGRGDAQIGLDAPAGQESADEIAAGLSLEWKRGEGRFAELQALANGGQTVRRQRLRRHEAPGGDACDQHDAMGVDD